MIRIISAICLVVLLQGCAAGWYWSWQAKNQGARLPESHWRCSTVQVVSG